MKNMFDMMAQAKALQEKMLSFQDEIVRLEVEGTSGAGLVKVVINGKTELRSVRIDPSLIKPDEAEILEDLIVAAHADAKGKMEVLLKERMQQMTGGLPMPPGFGL